MSQAINLVSIQNLSWDLLAILFLLIASIFYGLLLGKNRIILLLLSTYTSFAIFSIFPFASLGQAGNTLLVKILVFLAFIVLSSLLFSRSFFGHLFRVSKALSNISFFKIIILSFFQVGLFMSIFFSIVKESGEHTLAPLTKLIFTGSLAMVVWFLVPLLIVGLFKGRKNNEG